MVGNLVLVKFLEEMLLIVVEVVCLLYVVGVLVDVF